jgi:hypothetical protein
VKERVTAGPAFLAAAKPESTKIPVPIVIYDEAGLELFILLFFFFF